MYVCMYVCIFVSMLILALIINQDSLRACETHSSAKYTTTIPTGSNGLVPVVRTDKEIIVLVMMMMVMMITK